MTESPSMSLAQRLRGLTTGNGLRAQLLRGGLGSASVQALKHLLALALGIVLARALGAVGYGVYAYAFAVMNVLLVVAEAGVPTLLLREVAASHGLERWGLLRGALVRGGQFVLLASVGVSLLGLLTLWAIADSLDAATLYTMLLMLLILPLAALGKTIAHAMRGLHRVVAGQTVDMLLRPLLVLIGVGAIFLSNHELRQPQYAMAAQLAAAVVVLLVGWWLLARYLPVETRSQRAEYQSRQWLKSALPFTLIGGAGIINSQADIIMLGWFRSSEEIGMYRVAVQGATLVAFGLQAVGAIVAPQFARLYAQGDLGKLQRLVTACVRVILLAALPVAVAFVLAGGRIVAWVFGDEFAASHAPLIVLTFGQLMIAAYGLTGPLLSMTGYEGIISKAMWFSALGNVVLNLALIPLFGVLGAAISTAITLSAWHIFLFYLSKKELSILVSPVGSPMPERSI